MYILSSVFVYSYYCRFSIQIQSTFVWKMEMMEENVLVKVENLLSGFIIALRERKIFISNSENCIFSLEK